MFGVQLMQAGFIAYFHSKKFILAFLIAGVSAISIAAYIGIRTTSPPSLGCQAGWYEFMAGVDDNFADPYYMEGNSVIFNEPAGPSPGLQILLSQYGNYYSYHAFDLPFGNMVFGHTFEGIAPDPTQGGAIEEAFLEFRIRLIPSVGSNNDTISLRFTGPSGNLVAGEWTRYIGTHDGTPGILNVSWQPPLSSQLIQLNLGSLPNIDGSTTDLITDLNAQGFLDLYIQDDTSIDYALLRVRHSCPQPIRVPVELEPACTNDIWECTAWSPCSAAGEQTRVCTLSADCPSVETPKPAEAQSCTPPILGPVDDRKPAVPVCAQSGQSCGAGLSACCEGLTCTPSQGALWCLPPPPPQKPTDLKAEKFSGGAFHYGGQGSFNIVVENVGTEIAASPITITDELPPGLTYLSFSDPYSSDWSCTASGQKVTCVYNGPDISPGGFLPALTINVRIATIDMFPAATGDQVENCAIVEYPNDTNSGNNQGCVTAIITPN